MCSSCGCGDHAGFSIHRFGTEGTPTPPGGHEAACHDPGSRHHHTGSATDTRSIVLEQRILAKNDALAEDNRGWLASRGILAVNLMSSPGSGKTTLLERTIRDMGERLDVSVIEGDQETPLDAERIRAVGRPVVQVNTGAGCHLDADMVRRALQALAPDDHGTVFIENVGNLVCPAMFDLGENYRVVVASVTEGADKPTKYPNIFRGAQLVVLNKVDLLPYVDFEVAAFVAAVGGVNRDADVQPVSARTGEGLGQWYDRIDAVRHQVQVGAAALDGRSHRA